ncbi:fused DSP-PTPase phosphatase/NAD kinase-like protein [Calycomorphotria hydatis]|uniref:Tyrosine phosphatase family protein n=1 Tax=Calycomorphotria hydatis TaxID=2528027 RepID=A0A517TBW8_9PLAN|nr:dual specificity protein phosphatase family protein [Calycomorphotria hydatis]QDT65867.1 Tyrosine phosphatase family protein [Calycomorphotria hydatis]
MYSKQNLIISSVVAVLLTAGGGYWYWHHHTYKHLATHEEGMVYRAAWVEPEIMSELIERYQIRAVVNLCNPGEMGEQRWVEERAAVTNAGAKLLELPMPLTVDVDEPVLATHVEALKDPNNYPMLVHCQHGVTRTAKFIGMYDIMFRGKTADQTMAYQPLFGREQHNVNVRAFCQQFEKEHLKLHPTATASNLDVLRQ